MLFKNSNIFTITSFGKEMLIYLTHKSNFLYVFGCSHPVVFYYLNNHKITVKTTYNIKYALQRHVSTRRSHHQATLKTIFKMYKVTAHIWDSKGLTGVYTPRGVHPCKPFGIPNVRSYFVHLKYGFKCSLMMTPSSRNMSL